MSSIKRQTAYKCSVNQIVSAKYVQQQGLSPNYLSVNKVKIARINLVAILVSKEGSSLTVDDGSGQLQVMLFEERLKQNIPNLGSLLLIIGKPREYNDKRFLVPEIIKVLDNNKWMDLRKKELELLDYCQEPVINEETSKELVPEVVDNYQEKILIKIKELDTGEGAPFQDLIKSLNMNDAEQKVEELIKEGEIFEVKGRLKLL